MGPRSGEQLAHSPEERYTIIRTLAQGSFGVVQLARDTVQNCEVAIKLIHRGDKVNQNTLREITNHRRLRHPFIIRLNEVFLTPQHLAIVMEYAPQGDMFQYLLQRRGLPEAEARWCFQQLILAIDYCHRVGVANRDVKLENTLLSQSSPPVVKLCDFGYSKDENLQSAPGTRVGTTAYLAPEVILNTQGSKYDAKAADVWSCGVYLFVILAAAFPFGRPEDEQLLPAQKMHAVLQRILNLDYRLPPHASPGARSLLQRMLVADPRHRASIPDILADDWFRESMPPQYANLNAGLLARPSAAGHQTLEEMQALVREAMQTAEQTVAVQLAASQPAPSQPGSGASIGGQSLFVQPFMAEQWS